ncbi:hypothetical protein BJY00DRAFT_274923 [Aspergillus carlsbadensis]|nr:hypothetical protein BJY00DRAFT_274923 [Aspergillus carlsbadensis]
MPAANIAAHSREFNMSTENISTRTNPIPRRGPCLSSLPGPTGSPTLGVHRATRVPGDIYALNPQHTHAATLSLRYVPRRDSDDIVPSSLGPFKFKS